MSGHSLAASFGGEVNETITIFLRPVAQAPKLTNSKFRFDKKLTIGSLERSLRKKLKHDGQLVLS